MRKGENSPEKSAPTERSVGRPSVYRPEFREIATQMAAGGATDIEIAEGIGISTTTLYRWRHEHPDFREALCIGKEVADERVEMSLYHRAIGYSHSAVKVFQHKGEPVIVPYTEHYPPDIGAMTLWLANRRPDRWKPVAALARPEEETNPVAEEMTVVLQRAAEARANYEKRLPPSRVRQLIEAERAVRERGNREALAEAVVVHGGPVGDTSMVDLVKRPSLSDLLAQVGRQPSPESSAIACEQADGTVKDSAGSDTDSPI